MKIFRVCPIYHPFLRFGGSVVADYTIDETLIADGIDVDVLTCRVDDNVKQQPHIQYFKNFGSPIYGISPSLLIKLFYLCFRPKFVEQVIWFGGIWNALTIIGGVICVLSKQKFVISVHGMLAPSLIEMKSSRIKTLAIKFALKHILRRAHALHCTVTSEAEDIKMLCGGDINTRVIQLPVKLNNFLKKPKSSSEQQAVVRLGFIGRITRKKNLDILLQAFIQALAKNEKCMQLHIYGPDLENLWQNDLVHRIPETCSSIVYHGPKFDSELAEAYTSTDIFVLCSANENFAISVIEAAASGCALILDKRVGVSEFFDGNSAVLLENTSVDSLAAAILSLVNDDEFREDISNNASNVARKFDSSCYGYKNFKALFS